MRDGTGTYTDWRSIAYEPAIAELLPHSLLHYISEGQRALDVGCNTGAVALFLASHGLKVLGVDINEQAINEARERAAASDHGGAVTFSVADATAAAGLGEFDVLTLIRVLTCFPSPGDWRALLRNAYSLVRWGGIVYIHDFTYAEGSAVYRPRYDEGARLGWRKGNFAVNDKAGRLSFVAHHHTRDEVREITAPYLTLELNAHTSRSMNGNECDMFEFIGRKLSPAGRLNNFNDTFPEDI